jgi:Vitamin K-dependent gamma-carboxylase
MTCPITALKNFFFRPAQARPLGALRIAVAALLLLQTALLFRDLFDLFDGAGIVQGNLNQYLLNPVLPQLAWVEALVTPFGLSPHQGLVLSFFAYIATLTLLLVGFETRLAAFGAWLLHFMLIYNTGSLSGYGVDSIAHFLLFYFIFMPVGDAWSLDRAWARKAAADPGLVRLSLRVLQLHLCLIYFVAGIAKALGSQWWTGEAIWRATMLPQFANLDMAWLAGFPLLAKLAAWGTLVVEIAYPVAVWPKRSRAPWIAVVVALHASIFVVMGLHVFSLFMIALNLTVMGLSAEVSPAGANFWDRILNPKRPRLFPRPTSLGNSDGYLRPPKEITGYSRW